MSVQPSLRVGRKMATFQLFFQSSRAKDLSAPLLFLLIDLLKTLPLPQSVQH